MDLHSEQLHTATPDSYRLFLRRKRLVTLVLLTAVLTAALLSLTSGSAGLSLAEGKLIAVYFVAGVNRCGFIGCGKLGNFFIKLFIVI